MWLLPNADATADAATASANLWKATNEDSPDIIIINNNNGTMPGPTHAGNAHESSHALVTTDIATASAKLPQANDDDSPKINNNNGNNGTIPKACMADTGTMAATKADVDTVKAAATAVRASANKATANAATVPIPVRASAEKALNALVASASIEKACKALAEGTSAGKARNSETTAVNVNNNIYHNINKHECAHEGSIKRALYAIANAAPLSDPSTFHSTNNGISARKAPTGANASTGANAKTSITNARAATANAATVEIADAATAAAIELTANAKAIRDGPTAKYPQDCLDVHVEKAIAAFKPSTSWVSFVTSVRGSVRGRGDLYPGVKALPHPAAHLLSRFKNSE